MSESTLGNQLTVIELSPKQIAIKNHSDWFNELADTHDLFATTVVFKSGGASQDSERWLSEYRRVLRKFDKRLAPHTYNSRRKIHAGRRLPLEQRNEIVKIGLAQRSERLNRSVCINLKSYHEFDIVNMFKSFAETKAVHHVHGIIAIPKRLTFRIWDFENESLALRLEKDIYSMNGISSVLIEPLILDGASKWLGYIAKGKTI